MASYTNPRRPPSVEKPPLFHSGYHTDGFNSDKAMNFSCVSALSWVGSGRFVPGALQNDFKVPKVEGEVSFIQDSEFPSFKRPKISIEAYQLQVHFSEARDVPAVPLLASHVLPVNRENENVQVHNGSELSKTVDFESHFNPLSEPSPLGLNLRKSPSLLDLIQRKLAQCEEGGSEGLDQAGRLSRLGSSALSGERDKLKAANFPASKLRIGSWECTSRYDGDLVAKCYYAKRKLVWEVLDSGLKSKMEVQWSDISALNAVFPDDQSALLDIELSRPPLFFREINPQPRKHTLWQSTSDFTDGQATICRHHSVQFPVGVLNRHFEKLLQCDARLKALHEQTHSIQDSCFFDNRSIQIDRQHMLHYQSVSDHAALQPLTLSDECLVQPAVAHMVDHSQTHASTQAFQSERVQHFSPHHNRTESTINFRRERLRSESLQHGDRFQNDVGPSVEFPHRLGGFQLHFAPAGSPSSVIDSRGLNEGSSSSEAEEPLPVEICSEPLKRVSQESCRFSSGPALHLNEWASHCLQEGAITRNRENGPGSSPIKCTSEKQALNELSLHLLGEPITATEQGSFPLGRSNNQGVHEMFPNAGPSHVQQLNFTSAVRDLVYKHEKNIGNVHHGQLVSGEHLMRVRENGMLEHHAFEGGSSLLPTHVCFGDLVYLPRITSEPQFFEPGP